MTTTKDIQLALLKAGVSVGPSGADGVLGRATINGIRQFQRAHGLDDDGIVGPKTLSRLFPHDRLLPVAPWVSEANRYLGMHEVADAKKLDAILSLDASEIPWCGAFVAMVVANVLPNEVIPTNPLWALNWAKFGKADDLVKGKPHFGAIAAFKRNSGGHVGFVVGHDSQYVHLLGGNQSNKVSVTRVAKSQLVAYRYPSTVQFIGSPLEFTKFTGEVFNNEA